MDSKITQNSIDFLIEGIIDTNNYIFKDEKTDFQKLMLEAYTCTFGLDVAYGRSATDVYENYKIDYKELYNINFFNNGSKKKNRKMIKTYKKFITRIDNYIKENPEVFI